MEGGSFDGGDCGGSMRCWCVVGEESDYVGEGSCYGWMVLYCREGVKRVWWMGISCGKNGGGG